MDPYELKQKKVQVTESRDKGMVRNRMGTAPSCSRQNIRGLACDPQSQTAWVRTIAVRAQAKLLFYDSIISSDNGNKDDNSAYLIELCESRTMSHTK